MAFVVQSTRVMFHFASVRTNVESVDDDRCTWPALSFSGMDSSSMRVKAGDGAGWWLEAACYKDF
jgi:hypothetical protein